MKNRTLPWLLALALLLTCGPAGCGEEGAAPFIDDLENHQGSPDLELLVRSGDSTVSGLVRLEARVYSKATLLGVEFFVDDYRFDTDLLPPYSAAFDSPQVADGQHIFKACAADEDGDTACDQLELTVDNSPPEVSLTLPAKDSRVFFEDGPLELQLIQSDLSPVQLVEFLVNDFLVGQFTDAPFVAEVRYQDIFINEASLPKTLFLQFTVTDPLGQQTELAYNVTLERRLDWEFPTVGEIWASARILSNGNLVFGNTTHLLHCLSPEGVTQWSIPLDAGATVAPVVDPTDDSIYAAGLDGIVRAYTPAGVEKWTYDLGSPAGSDLAFFDKRVIVPVYSGALVQLSRTDGSVLFEVSLGGNVHSSPAVSGNGTVYVGCHDKNLYAIKDDQILWTAPTGGEVWGAPALGSDGTIYVGSNDGWVYAFDRDGGTLWSVEVKGQIWSRPLVTSDGFVYISSTSKYLTKLQATDGAQVWENKLGGMTYSSPTEGFDGSILVGTTTEGLVALDPDTGNRLWSWPVEGTIHANPLVRPGRLYFGTTGRQFFSLRY
jgi:outer membrane protein assembly factor BamB